MARWPKLIIGVCLGACLVFMFYPETPEIRSNLVKFNKYVMPTYHTCSGIGNQMFRVASLYGIGKHLERSPAMDGRQVCQQKYMDEIKAIFPNFYNLVKLKDPDSSDVEKINFGDDCCRHQDPTRIEHSDANLLVLSGNFFQSYKFFHFAKNEIIELFQFSASLKKSVSRYASDLFGTDKNHKMCVHVRRGDFITDKYNLETHKEFLLPAMTFVESHLRETKNIDDVSIVFIGIEIDFLSELGLSESEKHIYRASAKTRGEDLYFGTRYCDSIVLTASGSTFGWWISYLSPDSVPVYYNDRVSKVQNYSKQVFPEDNFLHSWHRIGFRDGEITLVDVK
uniref:Alpha-(1,6)-fucosyltransferase n=1 Tax=Panagrellus redivivus TaxID=6233 RepID=A0A7E4ZUP0_PANRE